MNILAFMAHAHDAAYFCAGALMKYKQQGHNIYIAVATGREEPWGAEALGAKTRLLGFEPGQLRDDMVARPAALTAMRWAEADIVITHAPWDGDGEHAIAGKLINDSLLVMCGKLHPADLPPVNKLPHVFYTDTMAGNTLENRYGLHNIRTTNQTFYLTRGVYTNDWYEPEAFVDISHIMDQKLSMIPDAKIAEGCHIQCRMRGIQMGSRFAEGYSGHRLEGHIADYRLLP